MAKVYDASLKWLIDINPDAWVRLLGLPYPEKAEMISADLATVTAEADRVIRVAEPNLSYLLHIELQASYDADMAERMLRYNVLLRYRHRIPVFSVVLLLRPEADGQRMSGEVRYDEDTGSRLEFDFSVVRLWKLSTDSIYNAGVGALPMAPLVTANEDEVRRTLDIVRKRIHQETTPSGASELMAATFVLLGLRHPADFVQQLLREVREMEESSTYQWLIAKGQAVGEARGKADGERCMLVVFASRRLGAPNEEIQARLESIQSTQIFEKLAEKVESVETWSDLLSGI